MLVRQLKMLQILHWAGFNKGIGITKDVGSIPPQGFLKGINNILPDANKFRPLEGFKNQATGQNINVSDSIPSIPDSLKKMFKN